MSETNKPEPLDLEFTKGVVETGLSILAASPSNMSLTEWSDFSNGVLALIAEVERLREENEANEGAISALLHDDTETEALKAENARLKAALEPFGKLHEQYQDKVSRVSVTVRVDDLRNAATAVKGE